MAGTSYLSSVGSDDTAGPAGPAIEQARLIREYGFEGASVFLHPTGPVAAYRTSIR
jgi:hypothetical protein